MVSAARRSAAPRTISPLLLAWRDGVEVFSEWLGLSMASTLWSMTLAFGTDLSQSALAERVPRRLFHHDIGTAARQAEAPAGTQWIASEATWLLANRASHAATVAAGSAATHAATAAASTRKAVCRNRGLAKANLTTLACVQAATRWRARLAEGWIRYGLEGATRFGADVDETIAAA
jgi:hypothetical protein